MAAMFVYKDSCYEKKCTKLYGKHLRSSCTVLISLYCLQESPILNFKLSDYMEFMMDLERRYRSIILKDLQNITKA